VHDRVVVLGTLAAAVLVVLAFAVSRGADPKPQAPSSIAATTLVAAPGAGAAAASRRTLEASSAPASLESKFVATVKAVSQSVVELETPVGLGSGVVVDTSGDIVTNAHVVSTYKTFAVVDSTGREHHGTLVGKFLPDDLAVIRVKSLGLEPLQLADSSKLQVGDIVLAVGNPLGLQSSVTQGIVSALGRTVTEQNGTALPDVVQTSAAINPGNSGGALVNLGGKVVGIPTLAAIDPENSEPAGGIGFAIPSNTVRTIAGQLRRYGRVVNSGRAYLGANLATIATGRVAIVSVVPHGPAAKAGLAKGDTISAIAGARVQTTDDIAALLANLKPGAKATVRIRTPAGADRSVVVLLGEYPGA
jgi:S1-C subfamily serine protease